jgi:beta-lactamase regulating signal transducer with metallopeptidase domain
MDAIRSAAFFLLAALLLALASAVGSALVTLVARRRLNAWAPRERHRALFVLALLPLASCAALALSALLPSLASLFSPSLDHCAAHDDHHAHLCFVHPPTHSLGAGVLLFLVFVGSLAFFRVGLGALRLRRGLGRVRALARTGERRDDLGVIVLESPGLVCLAAGLLRPRVLVSRRFFSDLSEGERAVVLAHEHAHVRRRDALVSILARFFAALHLPPVAAWITRELSIAAEEACDDEAGLAVGDRLRVAETILRVERSWEIDQVLGGAAHAFGAQAERRIESLLAPPKTRGSFRVAIVAGLVAAALVLASSGELHHLTETVLSVLVS